MNRNLKHTAEPLRGRRSLVSYLLGGSLAALTVSLLYPTWKYLIPPRGSLPKPRSVFAGKLDELKPNSGKIFRFGNKPGILVKRSEGDIRAFTAVCTHLDCTVQYREDLQHIWCACHNGHYDLNGVNIGGPPPRPLTRYKINIKGDEVFVSRIG